MASVVNPPAAAQTVGKWLPTQVDQLAADSNRVEGVHPTERSNALARAILEDLARTGGTQKEIQRRLADLRSNNNPVNLEDESF